jgi:hypothetical protein
LLDLCLELHLLCSEFFFSGLQFTQRDGLRLIRIEQPLELPLDALLALKQVGLPAVGERKPTLTTLIFGCCDHF